MTIKTCALAAMALATATVATAASADTFRFELNGEHQAVWTIDSNTQRGYDADNDFAVFYEVPGNYSDLPGFNPQNAYAYLEFYTQAGDPNGGFYIDDYFSRPDKDTPRPILQTNGPAVFAGDVSNPMFLPGYYVFTVGKSEIPTYSLTISAVPEPASWAMMLAGFAMAGVALRRRSKVAVAELA